MIIPINRQFANTDKIESAINELKDAFLCNEKLHWVYASKKRPCIFVFRDKRQGFDIFFVFRIYIVWRGFQSFSKEARCQISSIVLKWAEEKQIIFPGYSDHLGVGVGEHQYLMTMLSLNNDCEEDVECFKKDLSKADSILIEEYGLDELKRELGVKKAVHRKMEL